MSRVPCVDCGAEVEASAEVAAVVSLFDGILARRGEAILRVDEIVACAPCLGRRRAAAAEAAALEWRAMMDAVRLLRDGTLPHHEEMAARRGGFGAQFDGIAAASRTRRTGG